jgi:hypothetical protein
MKYQIRILTELHDAIQKDLNRPHAFAVERVGFLFTRQGKASHNSEIILAADYLAVPDDFYIEEDTSLFPVASINSEAIRQTMGRLLRTGEGVFHVHIHEHAGRPYFSQIDLSSIPKLAQSFHNISPHACHGGIVFSNDNGAGFVLAPAPVQNVPLDISIIGNPLRIFRDINNQKGVKENYVRQTVQ